MDRANRILLMMSGSIACAKATGLISHWVKSGCRVRVACTPSVANFVGRSTLEGLSGEAAFDDTFGAGRAMDHIALAQWADLIVVCPATSNLINKLAGGIADDAVTTLWQAAWGRGIPQFIVPAMNTHMWDYPATRDSVAKLRGWGVHVLPTADGELACGEVGAGRMLEPETVLASIDQALAHEPGQEHPRVLVTAGGTREPIDAVRYIGNRSTGRTSAALADALIELGFNVTWLGAHNAVRPKCPAGQSEFESFADLERELRSVLEARHFDLVVHAAAVSDFSVLPPGDPAQSARSHKLPSGQELDLRLVPTPKLLGSIREHSRNAGVKVAGFKLTVGASRPEAEKAVQHLMARGGVDWVVHNDLEEIQAGQHRFRLFQAGPELIGEYRSPAELAQALAERLALSREGKAKT